MIRPAGRRDQPEIIALAGELSKKGLVVSGGLAAQHYLPKEFHGIHDDIDFVVSRDNAPAIGEIISASGNKLRFNKEFAQGQNKIIEFLHEDGFPVHVEVTPAEFASRSVRLNQSVSADPVVVNVPDPNYLAARLLHSASAANRAWSARLDSIAYLCQLEAEGSVRLNKQTILSYVKAISGTRDAVSGVASRLAQVLAKVDADDLAARQSRVRSTHELHYAGLIERVRNRYANAALAENTSIELSHAIYQLPKSTRQAIANIACGSTGSETEVFTVLASHELFADWKSVQRFRDHPIRVIRTLYPQPHQPHREYVISDTHFDHDKIISYCRRPFADVNEMNDVMIRNWNRTVRPEDTVYIVGDLALGKRGTDHWLDRLNGRKILIMGDHDNKPATADWHASLELEREGRRILLVHDPNKIPGGFNGWAIHGHHHNNDTRRFPHFNARKKRINVSAELVDYTPVALESLLARMKK